MSVDRSSASGRRNSLTNAMFHPMRTIHTFQASRDVARLQQVKEQLAKLRAELSGYTLEGWQFYRPGTSTNSLHETSAGATTGEQAEHQAPVGPSAERRAAIEKEVERLEREVNKINDRLARMVPQDTTASYIQHRGNKLQKQGRHSTY